MKRTLLLLAIFLCMGATCGPEKPSKTCDALCFQPCDTLTGWNGTREADKLTALMDAHDVELATCDKRRAICASCVDPSR
jgi:hypothetical protein